MLIEGGTSLATDSSTELPLPVRLTTGHTTIEIAAGEGGENRDENHLSQTISRPLPSLTNPRPVATITSLGESPAPEKLAEWFETLLAVQQAAGGSNEFYEETARAVVQLVGLDRGMVLLRRGEDWEVVSRHLAKPGLGPAFSRQVLAMVVEQRRTIFQTAEQFAALQSQSLVGVEAVVASPVFDANRQIIGVVYGSRDRRYSSQPWEIQPLEAQIVQLLAAAVSTGLARVQREAEAARNRVLFEQFASPELARELERNPRLLEGSEREVTVMFADLRGFSRFAEQLGATLSYRLLEDVMDRWTHQVLEQGGVIIDYYGDGLAAMWSAPVDQDDHATRACRAAQAMLGELPALNEVWRDRLGRALNLGIGIHTGAAHVGNAGSRRRLKYGPRGHTVNLASRVEGATKQFDIPILITGSTRAQLPATFLTRRLCRVRVVGISGAVELFELWGQAADDVWLRQCRLYEQALECYEAGQIEQARRLLESRGPEMAEDRPSALLAARAAERAGAADQPFDSIWELEVK